MGWVLLKLFTDGVYRCATHSKQGAKVFHNGIPKINTGDDSNFQIKDAQYTNSNKYSLS